MYYYVVTCKYMCWLWYIEISTQCTPCIVCVYKIN